MKFQKNKKLNKFQDSKFQDSKFQDFKIFKF